VPHATEYVARFDYEPVSGQQAIPFKPSETIWFRYPNPLDEYSGLSPLAAARLAADTQSAAMKQNFNLFTNGISMGGLVTPNNGHMQPEAAKEIKTQLQDRAKGVANAHRWLVLLHDAKFQPMTLSPRDAEFVGLHKLTLEDICRPYGIPLDLVGGQRTYENLDAAIKLMWTDTIIPEAGFLADEITEQLLPMFGSSGERVDVASFDSSGVEVLQEDEQAKWTIAQGQLTSGAITINEWRTEQKLDTVQWGDVWWGSVALVPIDSAEMPEPPAVEGGDGDSGDSGTVVGGGSDSDGNAAADRASTAARLHVQQHRTRIAYGSAEHERIWRQFVRRTERHEEAVASASKRLFRQQEQAILTELGKIERAVGRPDTGAGFGLEASGSPTTHGVYRAAEPDDVDSLLAQIFNLARWKKRFRAGILPVLGRIIAAGGQDALDEITVGVSFDVSDPRVARFLERRAQRFAVEVNDTTWRALKASLAEGLEAGEGTDVLAKRVRAIMGDRIRSSEEVIARTETIGAYNGGTLEGWRQSGQVQGKTWLAALDDRTRETHVAAHNQTVGIDQDFRVGAGKGPAPGQIGLPEEDIQCRCAMLAVLTAAGG
jgi:HK97 family phage portal protein